MLCISYPHKELDMHLMILRCVRYEPWSCNRLTAASLAADCPSSSNTNNTLLSHTRPHVLRLHKCVCQRVLQSVYCQVPNLPEFSHCNLFLRQQITEATLSSALRSFSSFASTSCCSMPPSVSDVDLQLTLWTRAAASPCT